MNNFPRFFLIPELHKKVIGLLPDIIILNLASNATQKVNIQGYWAIDKHTLKYNVPSQLYFIQPPNYKTNPSIPKQTGLLIQIERHEIKDYIYIPTTNADRLNDKPNNYRKLYTKTVITEDDLQVTTIIPKPDQPLDSFLEFNCRTGQTKEINLTTKKQ